MHNKNFIIYLIENYLNYVVPGIILNAKISLIHYNYLKKNKLEI